MQRSQEFVDNQMLQQAAENNLGMPITSSPPRYEPEEGNYNYYVPDTDPMEVIVEDRYPHSTDSDDDTARNYRPRHSESSRDSNVQSVDSDDDDEEPQYFEMFPTNSHTTNRLGQLDEDYISDDYA